MSKLLYKYEDVFYDRHELVIMVDNNFDSTKSRNVKSFSEMKEPFGDYVDLSSPEIMLYIVFRKEIPNDWRRTENNKTVPTTYVFKKNKIYNFNNGHFKDELGNIIDDYHDIWYDPFIFAYNKDYDKVERCLKLKNINEKVES